MDIHDVGVALRRGVACVWGCGLWEKGMEAGLKGGGVAYGGAWPMGQQWGRDLWKGRGLWGSESWGRGLWRGRGLRDGALEAHGVIQ